MSLKERKSLGHEQQKVQPTEVLVFRNTENLKAKAVLQDQMIFDWFQISTKLNKTGNGRLQNHLTKCYIQQTVILGDVEEITTIHFLLLVISLEYDFCFLLITFYEQFRLFSKEQYALIIQFVIVVCFLYLFTICCFLLLTFFLFL